MRSHLLFLLLVTLSCVTAHEPRHQDGPDDDAICSSYSGLNSTCSACIIQGCSYCDLTGTNTAGLCLSKHTAHRRCNTSLVSSFTSLTQCAKTQHDLYESLAAFLPITSTIVAITAFIITTWYVLPTYATHDDTITPPSQGENPHQPLLDDSITHRIRHRWTTTKLTRSSGWCCKFVIIGIFTTVLVLSIVTVAAGMWSLQVDGDKHVANSWESATSGIAYDTFGMTTMTRDPSNHDHIIMRWAPYQCDNIDDDNYIRCSLHRIITSSVGVITILALSLMGIVMLQLVWMLLCCRSLSNYSVKLLTLVSILHFTAVFVYAGGAFLLQSRIHHDSNDNKLLTTTPTPYRIFLSISWNCCLAAAILNLCLLIPLTRIHINNIMPSTSRTCCWRKRTRGSSQDGVIHASMGVHVAIPVNAAPPAVQPQYMYGSYQQYAQPAVVSAPPASPAAPAAPAAAAAAPPSTPSQRAYQGQPLLGFTNEI